MIFWIEFLKSNLVIRKPFSAAVVARDMTQLPAWIARLSLSGRADWQPECLFLFAFETQPKWLSWKKQDRKISTLKMKKRLKANTDTSRESLEARRCKKGRRQIFLPNHVSGVYIFSFTCLQTYHWPISCRKLEAPRGIHKKKNNPLIYDFEWQNCQKQVHLPNMEIAQLHEGDVFFSRNIFFFGTKRLPHVTCRFLWRGPIRSPEAPCGIEPYHTASWSITRVRLTSDLPVPSAPEIF